MLWFTFWTIPPSSKETDWDVSWYDARSWGVVVDQGVAVITFPPRPHCIITRLGSCRRWAPAADCWAARDSATPTQTPLLTRHLFLPEKTGIKAFVFKGGKDWPDLLFYYAPNKIRMLLGVIDTLILNKWICNRELYCGWELLLVSLTISTTRSLIAILALLENTRQQTMMLIFGHHMVFII